MKISTKGFGLIEVLVALAIMAVGLLAVGAFQSGLVTESADSKTRAEAIALAQSRIEELRNYTLDAINATEFDTLFATITDGNQTTHTGTNTTFTRTDTVASPGDTKELTVSVTWVDTANETYEISLKTELAWESPSLAGEIEDLDDADTLVRSATGRAKLGEGQVGDGESPDTDTNGDLTGLLDRGDGDLRLTSDDDVVLTLKDACEIGDGGNPDGCTGFVEISGRVYIDTAAQKSWELGEIYVKASDAAFCQRYYLKEIDGEIKPQAITSSTTDAYETDNNSYKYFDYTCYLGGGWHGNVGIVFSDGTGSNVGVGVKDKVCQGDPTSIDAFADPRVASRRVYRGMTYLIDAGTGVQEVDPDTGLNIYYSIGVKDAMKLPDPKAVPVQASHDFVVTQLSDNDGASCIGVSNNGPMMRTDSNSGELFSGNPTDFYCLNTPAVDADGNMLTYYDDIKLDAFGFEIDDTCPFDPSDPPSTKYTVSGAIYFKADMLWSNYDIIKTTWMNTSDGVGNCEITDPIYADDSFEITYACTVYDWPDTEDSTLGWNGYVQINPDITEMACDNLRQYHTTVKSNMDNQNFSCQLGEVFNVYGRITEANGGKGITQIESSDGNCLPADDGLSYSCTSSNLLTDPAKWTGFLSFTSSKDICISAPNPTPVGGVEIIDNLKTSIIKFTDVEPNSVQVDITVLTNGSCP
ncbi:prepilin-type N-terminal cleavage/methylation domain-containing protein [Thalassotalea nanhaiensis]|uniref:Prepilin-type N-terminal cleavage/methylation domain-containing protein n=1 Tax=Thalassotalea nanhaiensis TaxID=3065648 RepID=A0ABY9TIK3_9GAMM|nr:prepilin-type N-terminal cleavage/methylation domain-containing protein [Colwelliaceae bacterium SQ345]